MTLHRKPSPEEESKGRAYLLAGLALKCIQDPKIGPDHVNGLNNVYQMMESYRTGVLNSSGSVETYNALERASMVAFPNKKRMEVAMDIKNVLRRIAYPSVFKDKKSSSETKERALMFFEQLSKELS